ncbi:MAG TPA: hypothetical protein VMU38_08875 [Candidatus Binatia bacterium]|nr:hypothetical protein [Candidatus Binatia bacterium]
MEPLAQLRAKIAEFPGYDSALDRRRSDQFVRSYLGEALADLEARCQLAPEDRARVDALMLRVAFADPTAFDVHDGHAAARANDGGPIAAADAATVALAGEAATVNADSASRYLDGVTALLDRRDATLRAAASKSL